MPIGKGNKKNSHFLLNIFEKHKWNFMKPLNTQIILERFHKRWGDRFDYSLVEYNGPYVPVKIRCKDHDHLFSIYPGRHWNGSAGCKYCQYDSCKLNTEEVLKRFKKTWNEKYDYSKFEYHSQETKSIIICEEHGEFLQKPVDHWKGHGCPKCALKAKHGLGKYDLSNPNIKDITGVVYILEIKTEHEHFYKIGISKHSGKKRIQDSGKKLSGKATVIYQSKSIPLVEAYIVEQKILNTSIKYTPSFKYNGWKESIQNNPVDLVKELINE